MKHKIVVFGGTGFIGSHVVEALVDAGQDVRCAVRGGSDKDFLLSLGVEIAALEAPSCSGFQTNIAEITQGCSIVYNCTADVRLNQTLDEYRKTQVEFTRVLAHAAAVQKGVRFVQLSTIEVYGETPAQAISEDYSRNPIFEFQQSVCEREQVLEEIAKETGLDYVIVRPASTFGRRYRFMKFMLDAHQKGRFPLIGSGEQKMSMVDTRDIGRAMLLLGTHPDASRNVFHVCGYEASMLDLKTAFDQFSGRESKAQILPLPVAKFIARCMEIFTPKSRVPTLSRFAVHSITGNNRFDASRIAGLGFLPKYTLSDTVKNILAYVDDDYGLQKESMMVSSYSPQRHEGHKI